MAKGMLGDPDGAAASHEAILAICQPHGESFYSGFSLWPSRLGLWSKAT